MTEFEKAQALLSLIKELRISDSHVSETQAALDKLPVLTATDATDVVERNYLEYNRLNDALNKAILGRAMAQLELTKLITSPGFQPNSVFGAVWNDGSNRGSYNPNPFNI